ncbi:MAG: 4Fe-4S binding protein [Gammaproteobacteria bacterium]|nr:4Fe-4S binding protein [Gammaproteobacteria bacterium]
MQTIKKPLFDNITQEFRLPVIDAESCVHSLCNTTDCHACVDACPSQAWILDDDSLGLDIEACDGCGLCVPACPSGALHVHFPWVTRQLGSRMIALFACDKSGINENNGILPCIHALGLRQLLQLYNSGVQHLLLATAACKACSRLQNESLYQRVERLNQLLDEHKKPPIIIMQRSNDVWKKVFRTDETVCRGTQVSRRDFLSGGGKQIHQQLLIIDPLNHSEFQTIPPGKLLPDLGETKAHWPWTPRLDESKCNGCNACIKLCPTNALSLIQTDDNSSKLYELNPQNCTGCGICTAVCESDAISIHRWILSSPSQIMLSEEVCQSCGNDFHIPQTQLIPKDENSKILLCRICQHHNYNNNLYQVLE